MGVVICSYDGRSYGWDNLIRFGRYLWEDEEGRPRYSLIPGESIHVSKDKSSTDVLEEIIPELGKKYKIGEKWRVNLGVCIHLPYAKSIERVKETVESIMFRIE